MIKVGNQSDLKKKKKLPTSNSETSDLCKPTTTTEQNKNSHLKKSLTYFLNFSRMDLKKTQYFKKRKKEKKTEKPDAVSKFVEPFLMLTRNLQT